MMKLPFVSRKKYEELESALDFEMGESLTKQYDLEKIKSEHMDLMGELTILKEDLKEKNQELGLTIQYNDIATNKICELNTKLVATTTKNDELETKIKELEEKIKELEEKVKEIEFCLEEAKKGNRKSLEIIKRTNMVKKLLVNLVTLKDAQGRILIKDGSVLAHSKVEGNKVYDIVRLLG